MARKKPVVGDIGLKKHLQVLLPATELIEVYFGYAMRAAFCAPVRGVRWGMME